MDRGNVDVGVVAERLGERRRELEERRERLALREPEREAGGEMSVNDQHPADTGPQLYERERDLLLRQEMDAELHRVDDAWARLAEGTYGRCLACGCTIPAARLAILPHAERCTPCEEEEGSSGQNVHQEAVRPPLAPQEATFATDEAWRVMEEHGQAIAPSDGPSRRDEGAEE